MCIAIEFYLKCQQKDEALKGTSYLFVLRKKGTLRTTMNNISIINP